MSFPADIHDSKAPMTPQVSPKDIPQDSENSETDEDPSPALFGAESGGSSSEDDEDETTQGYIPLSMDDGSEAPVGFIHESENDNPSSEQIVDVPVVPPESTSSSSSSNVASASIDTQQTQMDNDQVDLIRQVMSNITLPSSAVPDWAKVIPEERWKTSLFTSMNRRTDDSSGQEIQDNPEK